MSAAALQPAAMVFREEQNFAWWTYALLLGLVVTSLGASCGPNGPIRPSVEGWSVQAPVALLVGLGLPSVLLVGVLRMTTEVTPDRCRVWFGWLPTYREDVLIADIRAVEVITYRPLADCWGWGIRRSRTGERVLSARGDRAVRIELTDGTRLLIGSQRPEELAQAIERARRPVG